MESIDCIDKLVSLLYGPPDPLVCRVYLRIELQHLEDTTIYETKPQVVY